MARVDLETNFSRIKTIVEEINYFVPASDRGVIAFRGDLAGLVVVLIAATYETCVKDILMSYAYRNHEAFGEFAQNHFSRMSSRIAVQDRNQYARACNPGIHEKFRDRLHDRKEKIERCIGQNVEANYKLLLSWRHEFTHTGNKSTTVEEAIRTHGFARHVLYSFDDAFN